jgi:hypothetical protein
MNEIPHIFIRLLLGDLGQKVIWGQDFSLVHILQFGCISYGQSSCAHRMLLLIITAKVAFWDVLGAGKPPVPNKTICKKATCSM